MNLDKQGDRFNNRFEGRAQDYIPRILGIKPSLCKPFTTPAIALPSLG